MVKYLTLFRDMFHLILDTKTIVNVKKRKKYIRDNIVKKKNKVDER